MRPSPSPGQGENCGFHCRNPATSKPQPGKEEAQEWSLSLLSSMGHQCPAGTSPGLTQAEAQEHRAWWIAEERLALTVGADARWVVHSPRTLVLQMLAGFLCLPPTALLIAAARTRSIHYNHPPSPHRTDKHKARTKSFRSWLKHISQEQKTPQLWKIQLRGSFLVIPWG